MRVKRLEPSTIIPTELYVERGADRQLATIVEAMGRPGYVLVARQMGKTNLLLNMKRKLETGPDIVTYFDLSIRSDTLRGWFRRIVDTICEVRSDLFANVASEIARDRRASDSEPNMEFDRHLRIILRQVSARMVIVLDEIDALVSAPYADKIFSQIRSMYFARATYPEYKKLTYVLSGVAEPTDLIKDKALSPFNIGEKIYLDDFTRDEFDVFLQRSGLSLEKPVADAVYSWTGGNPRMTWDLCSELEDKIIRGETIDLIAIDDAVQKAYLTDYDRSPIDHIRTLVENDPQIRDAIVSIKYGKGHTLDDKVKSRLYLAGVVSSNVGTQNVQIKNKIIDAALSEKWIEYLARARLSLLSLATENFGAERYELAIRQFEEYLSSSESGGALPVVHRFELGMARFRTNDFDGAVRDFSVCLEGNSEPKLASSVHYHIGLALFQSGKLQQSIEHYEKAAIDESPYYLRALNNLGSVKLITKAPAEEVIKVNQMILDELKNPGRQSEDNNELISLTRYNLARVYQLKNDTDQARRELELARPFLSPEVVPAFNLFFYELEVDPEVRREHIRSTVTFILEKRLIPAAQTLQAQATFNKQILGRIIAILWNLHLAEDIERLLNFISRVMHDGQKSHFLILYDLWLTARTENVGECFPLLDCAVEKYSGGTEPALLLPAYRDLTYYAADRDWEKYFDRYLELFELVASSESLDATDFIVLWMRTQRAVGERQYGVIRRILSAASKHSIIASEKFGSVYALLLVSGVILYQRTNEKERIKETAKQILLLTSDNAVKTQTAQLAGQLVQQIRDTANKALSRLNEDPFRTIGRNTRVTVRYGDNPPVERKFKFVRDDLLQGRCSLVTTSRVETSIIDQALPLA